MSEGGNKAVVAFKKFSDELSARQDEISTILPPHIPAERFMQTAIIAAKSNPDLLVKATRRSLHQAITEAAEDGLMPDGREGAVTIYGDEAQWNPMLYGLRKRAMELAGMVIDAQVVHKNDHFIWHQGDDPKLEHVPAPLGTDRGEMVGAYAVFKKGGVILHREVMDKTQIETTRNQSRGWQKSLMWQKFTSEAWRKTVIRRGIKTVPSVPALERIVERDDREFTFTQGPNATSFVPESDVPSMSQREPQPLTAETIVDQPAEQIAEQVAEEVTAEAEQSAPSEAKKGSGKAKSEKPDDPLAAKKAAFLKALKAAETPTALNSVWDVFGKNFKGTDHAWATDQFELRLNTMTGG